MTANELAEAVKELVSVVRVLNDDKPLFSEKTRPVGLKDLDITRAEYKAWQVQKYSDLWECPWCGDYVRDENTMQHQIAWHWQSSQNRMLTWHKVLRGKRLG